MAFGKPFLAGKTAPSYLLGLTLKHLIIWLAPSAVSKMNQILRCDWLTQRARWHYLKSQVF